MCLIVLVQTALCGILRVIHCTSILLSMYDAVGPLIKHLMSFFSLWRAGVLGIEPLRASYMQIKFSTTELDSQAPNVFNSALSTSSPNFL